MRRKKLFFFKHLQYKKTNWNASALYLPNCPKLLLGKKLHCGEPVAPGLAPALKTALAINGFAFQVKGAC